MYFRVLYNQSKDHLAWLIRNIKFVKVKSGQYFGISGLLTTLDEDF